MNYFPRDGGGGGGEGVHLQGKSHENNNCFFEPFPIVFLYKFRNSEALGEGSTMSD